MMERFRTLLLVLWLVVSATSVMAEGTEPAIGIVNRTNCGKFWRLDFNYQTVDADGETPIVLSAAFLWLMISTPKRCGQKDAAWGTTTPSTAANFAPTPPLNRFPKASTSSTAKKW